MPGELRKREIIGDKVIITFLVDDAHDGFRADRFLKNQYKRKSRAELQKAIDLGSITIKGKRLKASTVLRPGDELTVITPKRESEPEVDTTYKVLFEDEYLIVVDKPGNIPVHPAGRFIFNTLVMAMRRNHPDWLSLNNEDSSLDRDFYLIHRLDRETSGVIILAKQKHIAKAMIAQFFDRKPEKRYFAVAKGDVPEDEFVVDADIGPASGSEIRLKMAAYPKGTGEQLNFEAQEEDEDALPSKVVNACTKFKVLARKNGNTLLDCHLLTGRQHQIRVHLAHKGYPVVGDELYGSRPDLFLQYIEDNGFTDEMMEAFGIKRHALHSRYLKFVHPVTGELMEIESPLPEDMGALLL